MYAFGGIDGSGNAIWNLVSPGASDVDVLGASSGDTSVSPSAGKITISGTSGQITSTGTSSSALITLSLPSAVTFPGSATTTTTLTAGTDLAATAGNVLINGSAKQLRIKGGAVTDFIGTGTLTSGTQTIANTNIATTDRIHLQRIAANGSTTLGELTYTISAATSFTVTSLILGTPGSTQTGDTSTYTYEIIRQI